MTFSAANQLRPQMVFAGRRVRIGPFTENFVFSSVTGGAALTTPFTSNFTVRVLARSPQQLNTIPALVEIGRDSRILGNAASGQPSSATFSIDVTLPGAISAVQIVGSIAATGTTAAYPSVNCANRTLSDSNCLQAGVNPLGVLLSTIPVTIMYEPPGNCSYASFTSSQTAGTTYAIDREESVNTQLLVDNTLVFGFVEDTHTNTQFNKGSQARKESDIRVQQGLTMGTTLWPTGDVRCTQVDQQANVPDRQDTGGPGKGDTFLLLLNAPMVYWNTDNLSNSRYLLPTEPIPSNSADQVRQVPVSAHTLQIGGQNLPTVLQGRLRGDLDAIVAMDPLAARVSANPNAPITMQPYVELPSNRYVRLGLRPSIGANGTPISVTQSATDNTYSLNATKTAYVNHKTMVTEDPVVKLSNQIAQLGIRAGATVAAGMASEWLQLNAISPKLPTAIQDAIGGASLPTFYQEREEIRTESTFRDAKYITQLSGTGAVQSFFIKDTHRSLDFQVYYDTLFGTFAYQELPAAMGQMAPAARAALDAAIGSQGQAAWVKTVLQGVAGTITLPDILRNQLAGFVNGGTFTLAPAPAADFTVRGAFVRGMPTGITVGTTLTGQTSNTPGVYQQAFYVRNSQGVNAGVFWMTVVVASPGVFGSATCERAPNPQTPGTEIVTCCSATGVCDSFVAPAGGRQLVEAESFTQTGGITRTSTGISGVDNGEWARYGSVDFGPFEGIIQSARFALTSATAGAHIELWVDGRDTATGTKLADLTTSAPGVLCNGTSASGSNVRSAAVAPIVSGTHEVFLVFRKAASGPSTNLLDLDWFELSSQTAPVRAVEVQYRVGDPNQSADNQIKPHLRIVNTGTQDLVLSDVKLRYWYTVDQGGPQQMAVDYAALGASNITGAFVGLTVPRMNADQYIQIGFTPQACTLPPGTSSGDIQVRFNKANWSNYDETNDFSYLGVQQSFARTTVVTAYVSGQLIWGSEPAEVPGGGDAASGLKVKVQYKDGDRAAVSDNHIKPHLNLVNYGSVDIPLRELTIRYWYSAEGQGASQTWIDYARLGGGLVTTRVFTPSVARPGADRAFEVGFTAQAGVLPAWGMSGEIQARFNKADWSSFNELDDYSFNMSHTGFADWQRVTVYRNGVLIWGVEP